MSYLHLPSTVVVTDDASDLVDNGLGMMVFGEHFMFGAEKSFKRRGEQVE